MKYIFTYSKYTHILYIWTITDPQCVCIYIYTQYTIYNVIYIHIYGIYHICICISMYIHIYVIYHIRISYIYHIHIYVYVSHCTHV